ncbi:hypothetical protein L486_03712 [Kwoniella mangroviensis CBS 10435]|uniref:Uncharacterized protein n=1 Tax=Kwoniella mangroviensis CBS 10435 TaxID=1331196 RepID=A0A1B9IUM9_9TREE|nr:hypothetical protein L486_03712 [Kwoniella mangroviensis CBS 10435]
MSRKRPYDQFRPNYQEDMLFPPPSKKSRNGPASLPQASQNDRVLQASSSSVRSAEPISPHDHFPRGHSPWTAKIGDNPFEAQLAQPVFRRLAPQTSLLPHWEYQTAPSTSEVNHGLEGNRLFPQRVDSAPSKRVRLSLPPPVALSSTTATTSAGDPHTQYRTRSKSIPVDIDRIPPTPTIDPYHTHSSFVISPSRRDRSASQSTFHPFYMSASSSALTAPVSLKSTTRGDHLLAQVHQKVDKLSRKATRTKEDLEVAQTELKALEDAGEVVGLRNQLQDANKRIHLLKSETTGRIAELTRYWSSKVRTMEKEHEVEMKEKDDKIRYLEAKVQRWKKEVETLSNAKKNDKVDTSSASRTSTSDFFRNHTYNQPSMRSSCRSREPFSDKSSSMKNGTYPILGVALHGPYRSASRSRNNEGSSRWNLDLTQRSDNQVHLTSTADSTKSNPYRKQAESDWLRKNRLFKSYTICPAFEASQRDPGEIYPFGIYDQLPDTCELDMERDAGPEEGDEVLMNGIKMRHLVESEAQKKPHGLDHINRDNEVHVRNGDDFQNARKEDALGIEEWDGFGEQDWDGFGVQDLEGFGVADDDGFGVADDDGFGEVDLEGYGCEEYEGFGVEEDDGFLIEEDDGLFVC